MSTEPEATLAEAITKAFGAVEGLAPQAWDAAVQAALLRASIQAAFAVVLLIISAICVRSTRRTLRGPDGDEPTARLMFPAILAFGCGLLGVLMLFSSSTAVALFNPEGSLIMKALAGK